jgi:hypothetical protein
MTEIMSNQMARIKIKAIITITFYKLAAKWGILKFVHQTSFQRNVHPKINNIEHISEVCNSLRTQMRLNAIYFFSDMTI